jgi:hypothetical protein
MELPWRFLVPRHDEIGHRRSIVAGAGDDDPILAVVG